MYRKIFSSSDLSLDNKCNSNANCTSRSGLEPLCFEVQRFTMGLVNIYVICLNVLFLELHY